MVMRFREERCRSPPPFPDSDASDTEIKATESVEDETSDTEVGNSSSSRDMPKKRRLECDED
jgi:hypothetical protein